MFDLLSDFRITASPALALVDACYPTDRATPSSEVLVSRRKARKLVLDFLAKGPTLNSLDRLFVQLWGTDVATTLNSVIDLTELEDLEDLDHVI